MASREIEENLKVENYKTLLPKSWQSHGQARILLYVRDDISLKVKPLTRGDTDLPSVSWEIGVGREKKTRVNFSTENGLLVSQAGSQWLSRRET